jgi:ribosome-associated toxin RatA of RatAB toxin-antitoxin module
MPDTTIGGKRFLRRAVLLDCPPEGVWDMLVDTAEVWNIMPKLKKCKLLFDGPDSQLVLFEAKPLWFLKTFSCVLVRQFERPRTISWRRSSGDFKALEGFWELLPETDGRTLAVYCVHFVPGSILQQWFVDVALRRGISEMLTILVERSAFHAKHPPSECDPPLKAGGGEKRSLEDHVVH